MEQLIMIPGTLCDESLFKHQVTGLIDITTPKVVESFSSDGLASMATKIINQCKDTFSLMGLSYGGILAFEIWRQAPERINKMILLNTNHKKPSDKTRENIKKFTDMAQSGRFNEITENILIEAMLFSEHLEDSLLREEIISMSQNVGEIGFSNQIKAQLERPDSTEDLKKMMCPTLIIAGKDDGICPVPIHQEIESLIPNSTLRVIENCGHLSTMEKPKEVNQIIRNWWKAVEYA